MKKKSVITLVSVVAVCAVGYLVSRIVNWPVDYENAGGNIAKSSRFSRKTASEGLTNLEELINSDEEYRNSLVVAYVVMKTRAQEFNALVDMSADVAGNIPAFESVLKDMKAIQPMVINVCTSVEEAGNDLNASLGGEAAKNLAQNVSNAALAYSTLQKQNGLADRFIAAADEYISTGAADDRLKFVRDQWLDYQQMSATLAQDAAAAEELAQKGYQLTAEQSAATLGSFEASGQLAIVQGASLNQLAGVGCPLSNSLTGEVVVEKFKALSANESGASLRAVGDGGASLSFEDKLILGARETAEALARDVDTKSLSDVTSTIVLCGLAGAEQIQYALGHGLGGASLQHGSDGAALEHGVGGAALEHGVDGAALEHGVGGAALEHGVGGAALEHGVGGAALEHGVGGASLQQGVGGASLQNGISGNNAFISMIQNDVSAAIKQAAGAGGAAE